MDINQSISQIYSYPVGGYSLAKVFGEYAAAVVVFLAVMVLIRLFKILILSRIKAFSKKTKTELDDLFVKIIEDFGWNLHLPVAVYIASASIPKEIIPGIVEVIIHYWFLAAVIYYGIKAFQDVIDYGARKASDKRKREEGDTDTSLIFLLRDIVKGLLWLVALLILLDNLGFEVSTLLAGLGIGGIAVAFALQNVLADIFASFSIYFDKPFKVGDMIKIGSDQGIVKRIGIKSTRLRTLEGQELVISNKELTESRVNNFGKMSQRRVTFGFGVTYDTPNNKLERIPGILKEIISSVHLASVDRVNFKALGNSSLDYEASYFIDTGDIHKYMDIQEQINLKLKERLEKEGIRFAYPTQMVYLQK